MLLDKMQRPVYVRASRYKALILLGTFDIHRREIAKTGYVFSIFAAAAKQASNSMLHSIMIIINLCTVRMQETKILSYGLSEYSNTA